MRGALVLGAMLSGLALAGAPAPDAAIPPKPAAPTATTANPAAPEAPQDWFEVELVVFRNTQPGAGASETWPADPGRPAVEPALEIGSEAAAAAGAAAIEAAAKAAASAANAGDSASATANPIRNTAMDGDATGAGTLAFSALPPSSSRLSTQWDKLVKSSRYEPLGYFAWVQPPLDRTAALGVRIASPVPPPATAADALLAGTASPAADPPFAFDAPPAAPTLPPLRTPLDGVATVGLNRYLYLTLDLVFQPGDLPPLADGTPAPPFRLSETRRMRSKELHYFDHPLFGVIALITPRPAPPETHP